MPKMEKVIKDKFEFKNLPTLLELEQKTVLMLTNNDFSFDFPEPTNPNVIPVGGLQILDPKPLPEVKYENNSRKSISSNVYLGLQNLHRARQKRNSPDVPWNQYEKHFSRGRKID